MATRNIFAIDIPADVADVQVEVLHTDDATIVRASALVGGTIFEATESSKRDHLDKPNTEIGVKLATGRAIRKLGRQILHDANALVRIQEHARQTAEAARLKSKAEREARGAVAKAKASGKTTAKKVSKKVSKLKLSTSDSAGL